MKKGEVAKFTLKSEYAYGASGSPPKIPANATLVFEIELLSFTNEKDLTSDGGVLKKVLQEGKEKYGPSPSFESKAKVHLVGRLAAGGAPFIDETKSIVIGDEDVPRGVEKAIESLKVEEKGLFTIRADYGYGAAGNAALHIAPNADLQYEIQLLELTKDKDYWQYDSFDDKFEQATLRKNQGNTLYTQGKYARAIAKYKRGADFVDYLHKATDEEKAKANTLKVTLFLNTAQCHLKTHDWKTAIEQCNKALEIDKKNAKGIFRRAQAHSALDSWDAARADFEEALLLLPGDADVIREYNKLKLKMKAQDERDRKVYATMFKSMFSSEPKKSSTEDKMDVDTPAPAAPVATN
jgi:FK506-binding protein 4/5